MELMKLLI
jgi:arginyl-tRNA synthetase